MKLTPVDYSIAAIDAAIKELKRQRAALVATKPQSTKAKKGQMFAVDPKELRGAK